MYKRGERVTHVSHGLGTVFIDQVNPYDVWVEFDQKPDGWDKLLEVSAGCLKHIQRGGE